MKADKGNISGQQTRRSMIARQENPLSINEPNIQDILALELSDTLINAAYNLTVTKITLGIQKFCDPLERLFAIRKLWAFEGVRIFANRVKIVEQLNGTKNQLNEELSSRFSILTCIDILKESSIIKQSKNDLILLTKEQQKKKVINTIVKKLTHMVKLLNRNLIKTKFQAFTRLQTISYPLSPQKQSQKTSIQQTFQKYQQSRKSQRQFNRRSIDKRSQRKSSNQVTYSLNKHNEYHFNRLKSPQRNIKSRNLLYSYGNTDKKASTCSQTQSNNSQKESERLSRECNSAQLQNKPKQNSNSALNKLKVITSAKNLPYSDYRANNNSRMNSVLINGSYFAEGTKERELEILRKKYFRLVEEFKDFSERFLQVIKEE